MRYTALIGLAVFALVDIAIAGTADEWWKNDCVVDEMGVCSDTTETINYPIYKAIVIFTETAGSPEQREIFGTFRTLAECLVHAQSRRSAMIIRKELYSGNAYCLYRDRAGSEAVLLR